MLKKTFTISNPSGLHVRPAGVFAGGMGKFESNVDILFGGERYNAKSVIRILSACIKTGQDIELEISGTDEQAAMDEAEQLIDSGLGES